MVNLRCIMASPQVNRHIHRLKTDLTKGGEVSSLDLCSLAWGDREGYVGLSVRDPALSKDHPEYWKDKTYEWPADRDKVERFIEKAKSSSKDVYWSPLVYSRPRRTEDNVEEANVLYADLDEADPRKLPKHLKPSAAWESSPGRFQALWMLDDAIDPDTHRDLNQRLTYAIGADKGGWGLSKVLRIPGTKNHKYDNEPVVELLHQNGKTLDPISLLQDLPEIEVMSTNGEVFEDLPDRKTLLRKLKLPGRVRSLLRVREVAEGTRSETLWALECSLAEVGCTPEEIVALVQGTGWNKFAGRHDELKRLSIEAQKAVAHVSRAGAEESVTKRRHDDEEDSGDEVTEPIRWNEFDRKHRAIEWIVADVWGTGEVGFISGLPKSYKSWITQDLAVSVSTGTRFLNTFQTKQANVLLVQEEDPVPVLQDRLVRIAASKGLVWAEMTEDEQLEMQYELPDNLFIISNQGFTIDEEWLDALEEWILRDKIELVILDPLMMISGEVDEFKAFEMMATVLKPLKRLRAATQAAICVVHHHIKGSTNAGARDMYGSVALWAWEEAALHLQVTGVGRVVAERFSKHALLQPFTLDVGDVNARWDPVVRIGAHDISVLDVMSQYPGGVSVDELTELLGMSRDQVIRLLTQMETDGRVKKAKSTEPGRGRKKNLWSLTA